VSVPNRKPSNAPIRLPRKDAGYAELSDFFDRHEGFDLLDRGIVEIDPRPSRPQAAAEGESTLVRMWVIEGMRREASQG